MRTIPWVRAMEKRYGERGLVIIGVHTPEFDHERSRKNVESAVAKHDLGRYSHFLDNQMRYWRALGNEYWPALYAIDAKGRIRGKMFGEIYVDSARDREVSQLVESLLTEAAAPRE